MTSTSHNISTSMRLSNYARMVILATGAWHFGFYTTCMNSMEKPIIEGVLGYDAQKDPQSVNTLYGMVNFLYAIGALVGTYLGGKLADKYGRRFVFYMTIITDIVNIIPMMIAHTAPLLISRFLLGFVTGMSSCIYNVILAELLPNKLCGFGGSLAIFFLTLGIIFANVCQNIWEYNTLVANWRWLLVYPIILEITRLILFPIFFKTDTPRFLYENVIKRTNQIIPIHRGPNDKSPTDVLDIRGLSTNRMTPTPLDFEQLPSSPVITRDKQVDPHIELTQLNKEDSTLQSESLRITDSPEYPKPSEQFPSIEKSNLSQNQEGINLAGNQENNYHKVNHDNIFNRDSPAQDDTNEMLTERNLLNDHQNRKTHIATESGVPLNEIYKEPVLTRKQGHDEVRNALKYIYPDSEVDSVVVGMIDHWQKQREEGFVTVSFRQLFSKQYRRQFFAGCFLAFALPFSGTNFFYLYSTILFDQIAGNGKTVTLVSFITNHVTSYIMIVSVMYFGRKPLLVFGPLCQGLAMLLLLIGYLLENVPLLLASAITFFVGFCMGLGGPQMLYISEILPPSGVGVAFAIQWLLTAVIGLLIPILVLQIGPLPLVIFFMILCLIITVIDWLFLAETRNKSVKEIFEEYNASVLHTKFK